jgi:hypothetical protein
VDGRLQTSGEFTKVDSTSRVSTCCVSVKGLCLRIISSRVVSQLLSIKVASLSSTAPSSMA